MWRPVMVVGLVVGTGPGCASGSDGAGDSGSTDLGAWGSVRFTTAPCPGVTFDVGTGEVAEVSVERCDGTTGVSPIGHPVSLRESGSFPFPPGDVCSVVLTFGAPIVYQGTWGPSETPFRLDLEPGRTPMRTFSPWVADGDVVVLELGAAGWFDPEALEVGGEVHVDPTDAAHEGLVATLRSGTHVFHDFDADAVVDPDERAAGSLAGRLDSDR
ncbi:MAG: hypothetical protein ABMB14_09365 [Myxococcota bacterium]